MLRHIGRVLRWPAFTAVVFLAIFSIVGTSQSFQSCVHEHKNDKAYHALHDGPSGIGRTVVRMRLDVSCAGQFANDEANSITAVATLLLVFVTAGVIWVGYMEIATTRRQLRAYVAIEQASIDNIAYGETPVASLIFRNTGQTPAYDAMIFGKMVFEAFPLNAPLPALEFDSFGASRETYGPGAKREIKETLSAPLNVEQVKQVHSGSHALWIYGEVRYTDTFGTKRVTTYRRFTSGAIRSSLGRALVAHQEGNKQT